MFCPQCGAQNPDNGVFCTRCGRRFTSGPQSQGVNRVAGVPPRRRAPAWGRIGWKGWAVIGVVAVIAVASANSNSSSNTASSAPTTAPVAAPAATETTVPAAATETPTAEVLPTMVNTPPPADTAPPTETPTIEVLPTMPPPTATEVPTEQPTQVPTQTPGQWAQSASEDTYADIRDHPDLYEGDRVVWSCHINKFLPDNGSGQTIATCQEYMGAWDGLGEGEIALGIPLLMDTSAMHSGDNVKVYGTVAQPLQGTNGFGATISEPAISVVYLIDHAAETATAGQ